MQGKYSRITSFIVDEHVNVLRNRACRGFNIHFAEFNAILGALIAGNLSASEAAKMPSGVTKTSSIEAGAFKSAGRRRGMRARIRGGVGRRRGMRTISSGVGRKRGMERG
jgi:hypothetical protein